MKNLLTTTLTAVALTAAFAGPASAASVSALNSDVSSVLGGDSNIILNERNGVVTVTGYFGDASDQAAALNVLKRADDVTKVINLAFD